MGRRKNREHASGVFPMLPPKACVEVESQGEVPGYIPPPPPVARDMPGRDAPEYMAWLAGQTGCDWPNPHTCKGRIEIHHEPPKGMGGGRKDDQPHMQVCA